MQRASFIQGGKKGGGEKQPKGAKALHRKRLEEKRTGMRKGIRTELEKIAREDIDFASEVLHAVDEVARGCFSPEVARDCFSAGFDEDDE